ncbi:MAG: PQQ-dependent sugar dehydrogenase [Nitrososphaera sp.]
MVAFSFIPIPALASAPEDPVIEDKDFVVQKYMTGICCSPVTIGWVNNGTDMIILQRDTGDVHYARNGVFRPEPVTSETITNVGEQGMLTIATKQNKVYLYFTEADAYRGHALGKRVYSYDWDEAEGKLVNKTLIKDMPQTQTYHNGGEMTFDKNGTLYIIVGDAGRADKLENFANGEPDDTAVVQQLVPPGPYYAMGIRNSFGLTTDPVTGSLWDTENGETCCDEVNIVTPKFNSGWETIMGPANSTHNRNHQPLTQLPTYLDYKYHDPQFTWETCVAPTGLAFPVSAPFAKYNNSLFVGDFNNGNLYRFELNSRRDGFDFHSPQLNDSIANTGESMDEIIFGKGFGNISDVKMGPDGYLYLVSFNEGNIYRIVPAGIALQNTIHADPPLDPIYIIVALLGAGGALAATGVLRTRLNTGRKRIG